MARGLYSALGRWPDEDLDAVCARLRAVGRALDDPELEHDPSAGLPEPVRSAVAEAVLAIRDFEARVGRLCGMYAEIVRTPSGRAIELGNEDHVAFGREHEDAAAAVARRLAAVLDAFGATSSFWFTMD